MSLQSQQVSEILSIGLQVPCMAKLVHKLQLNNNVLISIART